MKETSGDTVLIDPRSRAEIASSHDGYRSRGMTTMATRLLLLFGLATIANYAWEPAQTPLHARVRGYLAMAAAGLAVGFAVECRLSACVA